jgi:hypothetical protein
MSPEAVLARRREALELLNRIFGQTAQNVRGRINAIDKTWEQWVERTGELPPDFAAMPANAFLPDPLVIDPHGRKTRVQSAEQWRRQRESIKEQLQYWMLGRIPPAPGNTRSQVLAERQEGDATVRDVLLEFGPDHQAKLNVQILIPPGKGPFPVLVTNHPRMRPWVNTAMRRGWMGCIPAAADVTYIREDQSNNWIELYPEYDWGAVARWAFGAMRSVDYLATLPNVDTTRIIVGGHSRNSKSSLVAAAFDERFAGAIPSRGNSGDGNAWRLTSAVYMNEPIEEITAGMPHWFQPRLRFFAGRENKLPIDTNLLMSLVAPRALILSHAFTEHQGSALAIEQGYRSVREVYRFLGAEHKIGLYQQPGEHASTAEDVEQYFDFMEGALGRRKFPKPEIWIHGYSYDRRKQLSGESIQPARYPAVKPGEFLTGVATVDQWKARREEIHKKIRWVLGDEPPGVTYFPERTRLNQGGTTNSGYLGELLPRPVQGMRAINFAFGDDLRSELYIPEGLTTGRGGGRRRQQQGQGNAQNPGAPGGADARVAPAPPEAPAKLPVVIWLHPYNYAMGYARWGYWAPLTKLGFVVMTFDQIGFGSRNTQALRFYERYPKWSLLGKMVADTRAAIDSVSSIENVDASRIYVMGWALGAKVALYTAALDDRVAGVASACGFAPLRLDKPEKGAEGVRHYSHLHGLLPRLGAFYGSEQRLPVDYDEILSMVAPRPLYVHAPTLDRFNPVEDVKTAVEKTRQVYGLYGKEAELTLDTPVDFNLFDNPQQKPVYDWLGLMAGLNPAESKPGEAPR